jgi:hypothetical protein
MPIPAIREATTKREILDFIRVPWEIHKGNGFWVPPLIRDLQEKFDARHPFRSHAELAPAMVVKDGRTVGRVAAIVDHSYVEYHREKTGFFGFFESIPDPEVGAALLNWARQWLKGRGMEAMMGPMNPSTNDECALLVSGFDSPPCFMMPYNPPYYTGILEDFGLQKAMDLYAYLIEAKSFPEDRLSRILERTRRKNPDVYVRPIQLSRFEAEVRTIQEIFNDAWSGNWGFVPLTGGEIEHLAKSMKPLLVPDLVLLACCGDEPIGFAITLPDYNQVLRRLDGRAGPRGILKFLYFSRRIRLLRVMLMGVKRSYRKKGAEGLLYLEIFQRGVRKGYQAFECSWILENNLLMQHGIESVSGRKYKTYRIYKMPI